MSGYPLDDVEQEIADAGRRRKALTDIHTALGEALEALALDLSSAEEARRRAEGEAEQSIKRIEELKARVAELEKEAEA